MPFSVISHDIGILKRKMAAGVPQRLLDLGVAAIAEELQEPMTATVQAEEPVRTGELRNRTESDVIPMPGQALLETRSEAENSSGQFYAHWVFTEHRIVAWGHDTRKRSVPNEFPQRALARMLPEIRRTEEDGARVPAIEIARIPG